MCLAVMMNWSQAGIQIERLNEGVSMGKWERDLLTQCTVASLSQWIMMLVADHSLPQRKGCDDYGIELE